MRKLKLLLLSLIFILPSCDWMMDDLVTIHRELHDLREESKANKAMVEMINSSFQAIVTIADVLSESLFVEHIESITDSEGNEIGVRIFFTNSKTIEVYHGKDGSDAPDICYSIAKAEDGKYYWTMDGEWILDNEGNRVPATSNSFIPIVEIRNGYWYASYDGGKNWVPLGQATGNDGFDGDYGRDSIIGVDASSNDFVVFTMPDGTEFIVPYRKYSKLHFADEGDVLIASEETIALEYDILNADESAYVVVESDGYYSGVVEAENNEKGIIYITCPRAFEDGYVNVMLFTSSGISDIKILHMKEKSIRFDSETNFTVSHEGGEINFGYTATFKPIIKVHENAAGWLYAESDSERIHLAYDYNSSVIRSGLIYIYAKNSTEPNAVLIVTQNSKDNSISQGSFVIDAMGGSVKTEAVSANGISVSIDERDREWIESTVIPGENRFEYTIVFTVAPNPLSAVRESVVTLYTDDGKSRIAEVLISQEAASTNISDAMIVTARPNFSNDFTAALPIYRYPYSTEGLDCYIDWGDGSGSHIEHYTSYEQYQNMPYVSHQYHDVIPGQTFDIVISGTVPRMSSENIPELYRSSIVGVKQWGRLKTESMDRAFEGYFNLKSIPTDNNHCFSYVTNFNYAFINCESLVSIPDGLFRNATACSEFNYTFCGCRSLLSVPDNLFENCTRIKSLWETFYGCSMLTKIPESLFSTLTELQELSTVFCGCGLIEIPEALFKNNTELENLNNCFNGTHIKTIPAKLLSSCTKLSNIDSIFRSCEKLQSVPVSLFDNNKQLMNVTAVFGWTGGITGGESPYSIINGKKVHLYERHAYPDHFVSPQNTAYCFTGCQGFSDYNNIPDDWK